MGENLIKVCLCDRGRDVETPWAEDLGPADGGPEGSRRVRLVNVPFLHAKPTWGDVIVVSPVDGMLTWDSGGVPWSKIDTRIDEDGGRYAMIVDYASRGDAEAALAALDEACRELDVACESAWGPGDGKPGRAYLGVPDRFAPAELMGALADVPVELTQVHPKPARGKGAKSAKSAKGARGAKATKATQGAKKAKPRAKVTKGAKATKKAAPRAKSAKGAKSAKRAKATARAKGAKATTKATSRAKGGRRPKRA